MTDKQEEKLKLATAMRQHREVKVKNFPMWKASRDQVIRAIIDSKIPNWGGIQVRMTKLGV